MRYCLFIGDMYREYSLRIIRNLDDYAIKNGHRIDVFGVCSLPSTNPLHVIGFKSILSLAPIHEYDGIILCYDTLSHESMAKDLVEQLLNDEEAPPVVCIRAEISGFFNIIPDNRNLMHEVAEYVLTKCKKDDIGFVTGRDDLIDSSERRAGFEDAMHEKGFTVDESKIFHGDYWIDQGPEMADFFIREDGTLPEAIICSNDYEAIALSDELIKRGFKIPEDVIVSGVDNASDSADHVPSLTTTAIPEDVLVKSAMEVFEKLAGKENPDLYISVPATLIPRESTGDPYERDDVYKVLHELKLFETNSMDFMREFVVMSMLFEGALTMDAVIKVALDKLKEVESVKSCYLCRYCETDRSLIGYYQDRGDNNIDSVSFPNEALLPEGFIADGIGTFIFLPMSYKNEVYGYACLDADTAQDFFINFKIEYLLSQIGQSINRLELYSKLFGISDVISLYIKDPMTGMLNRRGFEKRISEMFGEDGKSLQNLAIVSIDMDLLKYINDNFGHNNGDEAIKEIGRCVDRALKAGEFVARMGGDEFAAVLILSDVGRLGQFIRNVRSNIKEINDSGKYPFELSASIGTCGLTTWNELMDCMNKADKAMYLEKKAKKRNR
ncbi:MAG: GGDEF domain-containing protein [Clostridiales bacterium]|nr:GGDEF domain-containing protein [Clostridiales bacterium]